MASVRARELAVGTSVGGAEADPVVGRSLRSTSCRCCTLPPRGRPQPRRGVACASRNLPAGSLGRLPADLGGAGKRGTRRSRIGATRCTVGPPRRRRRVGSGSPACARSGRRWAAPRNDVLSRRFSAVHAWPIAPLKLPLAFPTARWTAGKRRTPDRRRESRPSATWHRTRPGPRRAGRRAGARGARRSR